MRKTEINDLKRRLPQLGREFSENNLTLMVSLILLAAVAFIYSSSEHIWVLLIPSLMSPFLAAAYIFIQPLNPYSDVVSRMQGMPQEPPAGDAVARNFLTLLSSWEAKKFVLRVSCIIGPSLCGWVLMLAGVRHHITLSFDATHDFGWIAAATFLLWAFNLGVEKQLLLRWAFTRLKETS